ncbi:hypothetical protein STEG23_009608 [Scotinomys teguina]
MARKAGQGKEEEESRARQQGKRDTSQPWREEDVGVTDNLQNDEGMAGRLLAGGVGGGVSVARGMEGPTDFNSLSTPRVSVRGDPVVLCCRALDDGVIQLDRSPKFGIASQKSCALISRASLHQVIAQNSTEMDNITSRFSKQELRWCSLHQRCSLTEGGLARWTQNGTSVLYAFFSLGMYLEHDKILQQCSECNFILIVTVYRLHADNRPLPPSDQTPNTEAFEGTINIQSFVQVSVYKWTFGILEN